MRESRPLVACQSARASRPASSSSGSLIASLASFSSVAAWTSILVGRVMDGFLLVDRQGGPVPGPQGHSYRSTTVPASPARGDAGQFGLAGEEPEPGRPRIPCVDDRGARDEV